jgi:hypothetical protein
VDIEKRQKKLEQFKKHLDTQGRVSEKKLCSDLRSAIRAVWMKHDTKLSYLYEHTIPDMNPETRTKWLVQCECCKEMFKLGDVEINHKVGEHSLKTLEDVLSAIRDSDYNAKTLRNSGHDYVMIDKISERLFEMIMGLDKEKSGKLKLEITSSKEFMKKGKNLKTLTETDRKKFDKTKRDIIARIATLMSRLPIICELGYETVEEIIENLPDNLFYGATKTEKAVLKLLVQEKIIDTYKVNLQLVR